MAITVFWTLRSIPELANLPARERGVRWRRAYRHSWRHWQTWAGLITCAVCAALGVRFGVFAAHPIIGGLIGSSVGGFVFGQTTVRVVRFHYRDLLLGLNS